MNTIDIHAPASRVWNVLVDPEQTKKYMFGCETASDRKPGSPLLWRMIHEGKEFIPVKGYILAIRRKNIWPIPLLTRILPSKTFRKIT